MVWLKNYVKTTVPGVQQADNAAVSVFSNPVTNGSFTLRGTENISTVRVLQLINGNTIS